MKEGIKNLQKFYTGAIRAYAGNLEGMKEAILAVFYHLLETPCHVHCDASWCTYKIWQQKKASGAIPRNTSPPPHKHVIPDKVSEYIYPVFEELSRSDLLERCLWGATQNPNESFHNVIWSLTSKTSFFSTTTLRFALHLAVLQFNLGRHTGFSKVLSKLELPCTDKTIAALKFYDGDRIAKADKKQDVVSKRRCKHLSNTCMRHQRSAIESE